MSFLLCVFKHSIPQASVHENMVNIYDGTHIYPVTVHFLYSFKYSIVNDCYGNPLYMIVMIADDFTEHFMKHFLERTESCQHNKHIETPTNHDLGIGFFFLKQFLQVFICKNVSVEIRMRTQALVPSVRPCIIPNEGLR